MSIFIAWIPRMLAVLTILCDRGRRDERGSGRETPLERREEILRRSPLLQEGRYREKGGELEDGFSKSLRNGLWIRKRSLGTSTLSSEVIIRREGEQEVREEW